ncbi:hypothetical protein [Kitasatospora sp. NPDC087271]|uniref:hypothetical protein n=1 Tax=Kitasatospora sp. NPDC087271 TaxID=3364067 RepID=UPI0037F33BB6
MASAPGWNFKWATSTWSAAGSANASTLTWDVEGKLASLAQGSAVTTYVYDADGNQLIRRNPGKVTVNLGGGDELTYDTGTKTSSGYFSWRIVWRGGGSSSLVFSVGLSEFSARAWLCG